MAPLRAILLTSILVASGTFAEQQDSPLTLALRQESQSSDRPLSSTLSSPTTIPEQTTTPKSSSSQGISTTQLSSDTSEILSSSASSTSRALSPDATTSISVKDPAATSSPRTSATTASDREPQLPLQPVISPALGVAGVTLMISGIVYTLIGIRSNPLYIFFSAAYLVALAIVTLIVYLAHPPISQAVQGAFLIATVIPACVIGGISLIFRDLTEFLGCLLGGFCLGMWLLILKDGGLVSSTGGRVGIIAGFSIAGLSLSFSHYTRSYGLIACISFAGATATVLGIDCFSRAGLKEFWLYLWGLNDQIFPHGTTTYPVTKGIKAEAACIIIIMVFGFVSQLKLWKTIKESRQKRNHARAQGEEEREHLEAETGRAVKAENDKGLAQWEAVYGDKATKNSLTASTATATESTPDSIQDLGEPAHSSSVRKAASSARKTENVEEVELTDLSSASIRSKKSTQRTSGDMTSMARANSGARSCIAGDDSEGIQRQDGNHPPVPPLPFKVPRGHDEEDDEREDVRSHATAGDSVYDQDVRAAAPNKQYGSRRQRRMTSGFARLDDDNESDFNGETIPHLESRRSSVAATIDGLSEDGDRGLPDLSRSVTPQPLSDFTKTDDVDHHDSTRRRSTSSLGGVVPPFVVTSDSGTQDANRRHSSHLSGAQLESKLGSLDNLPNREDSGVERGSPNTFKRSSVDRRSAISSSNSNSQPQALTKDALPEAQSHTVSIYRTNEWAKHAAIAENPSAESFVPDSEQGVAIDYQREPAARVDVQQLEQTAFSPQAPVVARKASSRSVSSAASKPALARMTSNPGVPVYSHASISGARQPSVQRSSSNLAPSEVSSRKPSNGLSEKRAVQQADSRINTNTLMGRRDDMMRNRISTTSFANFDLVDRSSNTLSSNPQQPRSTSNPTIAQAPDDDNIPLAQYRQQLQHRQSLSRSPQPPSASPSPSPPQVQRTLNPQFRRHSANLTTTANNSSTSLTPSTTSTTAPPQPSRTASSTSLSYAPANPSRLSQVQNAPTHARTPSYRGQSSPHLLLPQNQHQRPLKRSVSAQSYTNYAPSPSMTFSSTTSTSPTTLDPSHYPNTHQPPRRSSTATIAEHATRDGRLASWRNSLGADADIERARKRDDNRMLVSSGPGGGRRSNMGLEEAHRRGLRRLQSLAE